MFQEAVDIRNIGKVNVNDYVMFLPVSNAVSRLWRIMAFPALIFDFCSDPDIIRYIHRVLCKNF